MKLRSISIVFLLFLSGLASGQILKDRDALLMDLAREKAKRYELMHDLSLQYTDNQDNYDVKYYNLNLFMDIPQKMVSGYVGILSEVINTTIDHFDLNFLSNMVVDSILQEGNLLDFIHADDIVRIDFGTAYRPGDMLDLTIYYHGNPEESGYYAFGFDTMYDKPMIWSMSEPFGARSWWPCKDFPSDKADSMDIKVTVPQELIVASNGTLHQVDDRDSVKTYWWHEKYPIVTYLVSVAIYPYTVYMDFYKYSETDSMEVQHYVYEPLNSVDRAGYRRTVRMLEIFSDLFGEYPFLEEKYGHAVANISAPGMEHQTLSSVFDGPYELLNVHELAHQWWGDMVTCDNFNHIWLNEGFATYAEALYWEQKEGVSKYLQDMQNNKYLGSGTVLRDEFDYRGIFNMNLSYKKAAWVLHMLRHIVGDSTFFNIIKTYGNDTRFQYGTAVTEDFLAVCEEISGLNLEKFFHQWIYEEYYPTYAYTWNWTQSGNNYDVELEIQQLQTNHIFWMPIDVRVTTTGGLKTFVIWDSLQTQTFQLTLDSEPVNLDLDPDEWILRIIRKPLENPSFDRGILMVNGLILWLPEQIEAYENRSFWGEFPITLWESDPYGYGDTYPSTLPDPIGYGRIPSQVLEQYSTIIWVGDGDDNWDIPSWLESSMLNYLEAGGNVLLLSPYGQRFFQVGLNEYLGVNWAEDPHNSVLNCISAHPDLIDMESIKAQSRSAVFDTTLTSDELTLLFMETSTFEEPRGLGVLYKPETGGTHRASGGQLVFISGRPERFSHSQLRSNVEYILEEFFNESKTDVEKITEGKGPIRYELMPCYPNPFNESTSINYSISKPVKVWLHVYNLLGEEVETLVNKHQSTGFYQMIWKADALSSGIYFVRLNAGEFVRTRKVILQR
jgi:hypothetical protein